MIDYWPYESGLLMPLIGKRTAIPDEFLKAHSLVLGKTGTGKSRLLSSLINAYENLGMTVIVLDPHGELWKFSAESAKIVSISPYIGRKTGYLKFNMMAILPYQNETERLIIEDFVIHNLKDIFSTEDAFSIGTWGPRVELIFTIIPRLLFKYRIEPTLQDMADILLDYYKRKDFMSSLEPEERKQLYSIFNLGYEFISSTVNKILPLLSEVTSKNLFSSKRDYFDISKISGTVYFDLSGEHSPPSLVRSFSIMLLYKIWINVILKRMKNVVVVMDEVQTLSPSILSRIVSEGRKFSLWSVMATQSLNSLPPNLTNSLRTNVHNFFLFQTSEEDRKILHIKENIAKPRDFHSFVCYVPRDETFFSGTLRAMNPTRDFHISEDFYDFDEDSKDCLEIQTDRMESAYVSQLVSKGLAFVINGKIVMSEDYFKKIGLKGRRGNESFFHRYLITRAYIFFKNRGYDVAEGIEYKGKRPDLMIRKDGLLRPIECEYSDIESPKRMEEKVATYGDLVFATFPSLLEKIPEGSDVLLIPPVGDPSEPEFIERKNNRF
ncbi:MAG: DUF87 domain-containing protein [Thermoplasmatales archaeon]